MKPEDARALLRYALENPNRAATIGSGLKEELGSIIPGALATAATYWLSDWVGRRFGAEVPTKRQEILPPMQFPMQQQLESKAAGDGCQIEPPENTMSWQKREQQAAIDDMVDKAQRSVMKRIIRKAVVR